MAKRFLLLLIFGSFCVCLYSQQSTSLQQIIFSETKNYDQQKKLIRKFLSDSLYKNFEQTLSFANHAIKLSRSKGDSLFTGELLRTKGSAEYFSGKYDKAAADFYESIRVLQKTPDQLQLAYTHNELAKLYRKIRKLDLSMENYDKALDIFKTLKDSSGIAMVLNESGVVFEYQKDYPKALERYQASLEMATLRHDSIGVSYALSFIAGVYVIEKKFKEADSLLLQSLKIREMVKDSFAIALNLTDLGAVAATSEDYQKAAVYYARSNSIAEQLKYQELLASNYGELSAISEKQKDFKNAFYFHRLQVAIKDSMFNLDKTRQIETLSIQYQTQKKEQQIRIQKEELKRKNIIIGGTLFILLLTVLLGMSIYRRRKLQQQAAFQKQQIEHKHEATTAVIEAEERERQRIAQDLHDGVGQMMSAAKMNLSAFESEVSFTDNEKQKALKRIINLVDNSCKEIRNAAHDMMPNALLQNNFDAAIKAFVDQIDSKMLQVHVFTDGLDENTDSNTELVLYRIIQECVNNVIKHAQATTLDISVIKDNKEISATIEDNGIGFNVSEKTASNKLGLRSIKARVEYLNGIVEFNSGKSGGTLVTIIIPIKQNK